MATSGVSALTATGSALATINFGDNVGKAVLNGTYTGVSVVLEGSVDNTTFEGIPAVDDQTGSLVTGTQSPSSSASKSWSFDSRNWGYVRLRVTAISTGTANCSVYTFNQPNTPPVVQNVTNSLTSNSASNLVGYATGAGGTVTQLTSRTTGVTLNKPTGQITMFSAAGSATAATFTVTNSVVTATSVIVLNVNAATNLYELFVTAVAAGSFNITFLTTGGTSTDAPVINFAVIAGATS